MPKWILARTLTLVGILGVPFSGAAAKAPDASDFKTEREARDYLRTQPTGPRANAAFLALSEFRTLSDKPGLSRDEIVSRFGSYQVAQSSSSERLRLPSETSAQDMY